MAKEVLSFLFMILTTRIQGMSCPILRHQYNYHITQLKEALSLHSELFWPKQI